MEASKLLEYQLSKLPLDKVHPLHEAMFLECCEKILASTENIDQFDIDQLAHFASIAFITSNNVLKTTLKGLIDGTDSDEININYRDQVFVIKEDSYFLKDE